MMWWESKARSGSTAYPYEEDTDHSKIPEFLSVKLDHLKIDFEIILQVRQIRFKNDYNWLQIL